MDKFDPEIIDYKCYIGYTIIEGLFRILNFLCRNYFRYIITL